MEVHPAEDGTDVEYETTIWIKYDSAVDELALKNDSFVVKAKAKDHTVTGDIEYDEAEFKLELSPDGKLKPDTVYQVTVKESLSWAATDSPQTAI